MDGPSRPSFLLGLPRSPSHIHPLDGIRGPLPPRHPCSSPLARPRRSGRTLALPGRPPTRRYDLAERRTRFGRPCRDRAAGSPAEIPSGKPDRTPPTAWRDAHRQRPGSATIAAAAPASPLSRSLADRKLDPASSHVGVLGGTEIGLLPDARSQRPPAAEPTTRNGFVYAFEFEMGLQDDLSSDGPSLRNEPPTCRGRKSPPRHAVPKFDARLGGGHLGVSPDAAGPAGRRTGGGFNAMAGVGVVPRRRPGRRPACPRRTPARTSDVRPRRSPLTATRADTRRRPGRRDVGRGRCRASSFGRSTGDPPIRLEIDDRGDSGGPPGGGPGYFGVPRRPAAAPGQAGSQRRSSARGGVRDGRR